MGQEKARYGRARRCGSEHFPHPGLIRPARVRSSGFIVRSGVRGYISEHSIGTFDRLGNADCVAFQMPDATDPSPEEEIA
jgi:hypothetical protein